MQFETLLFEYRCDINQAFYVTVVPYSAQNDAFTGEPLHKTDIFCHSDLYRTLQEQRPSTKSRKSCRTVLVYGIFPLFCPASIIKMAQKMMDGFIRDTTAGKWTAWEAPLSAYTLADNSKLATQLSQKAALPALCSGVQMSLLVSSLKMTIQRMAKGSIHHNDSARHILLRLNPLKLSDVVDDEPSGFSPPYNTKRKSCDFLFAVRGGF